MQKVYGIRLGSWKTDEIPSNLHGLDCLQRRASAKFLDQFILSTPRQRTLILDSPNPSAKARRLSWTPPFRSKHPQPWNSEWMASFAWAIMDFKTQRHLQSSNGQFLHIVDLDSPCPGILVPGWITDLVRALLCSRPFKRRFLRLYISSCRPLEVLGLSLANFNFFFRLDHVLCLNFVLRFRLCLRFFFFSDFPFAAACLIGAGSWMQLVALVFEVLTMTK